MSIVSTNKDLSFITPTSGGGVSVNATWENAINDFTVTEANRYKIGYTGAVGENLVIPETFTDTDGKLYKVTSIDEFAFQESMQLLSIIIPNGVTKIGDYAFYNCPMLSSVTIPNSVISIGSTAFQECTSLTTINIPNSVTDIGDYAFNGCSALTTININKPKDSISGAPWSAPVATVNWLG